MKKAKRNVDTRFNQPCGVAITVSMRTAMLLGQCQSIMAIVKCGIILSTKSCSEFVES